MTQNVKFSDSVSFSFSGTQGINYEKYRPKIPQELLLSNLDILKNKRKYIDVATGTGQTLFQLARFFQKAQGVDITDIMLENAKKEAAHHQNINIYKCSATQIKKVNNEPYDLITVSQAFHFFDTEKAIRNMHECLDENGVLAVYGYITRDLKSTEQNKKQGKDKNSELFQQFYDLMRPYYRYRVADLEDGYTDKPRYPFQQVFKKVQRKNMTQRLQASKQQLLGYLKTLSGYNYYMKDFPEKDPLTKLEKQLDDKIIIENYLFCIICQK